MKFGGDEDDDLDLEQPGGQESDEETDVEVGDDEEGDAEGHERDGAEEGAEEAPRQEVRSGRAADRIRAVKQEARQATEEAAKLRRELEEFKKAQTQKSREPDPELERQRYEMMTTEERLEYRLNQSEQRHQAIERLMQVQAWDTSDRANYAVLAASDPIAAKYKDEVERLHREQLQQGTPLDRETILNYVAGKAARARGGKDTAKQRATGQKNLERQRVTPASSRGNVSAERRGGKSLEERLADVTI